MMTNYNRRRAEGAERERQKLRDKKEQVRQWLIENDAPKDILDLLDEVARMPTFSWC